MQLGGKRPTCEVLACSGAIKPQKQVADTDAALYKSVTLLIRHAPALEARMLPTPSHWAPVNLELTGVCRTTTAAARDITGH